MFRQVVVYKWAEGATPDSKEAFRRALDALRQIPELLAMTWGDDAGYFDDNFDFVVVADFDSFESARRYVAHPLHQAYVHEHVSRVIADRVIVQHEMGAPVR